MTQMVTVADTMRSVGRRWIVLVLVVLLAVAVSTTAYVVWPVNYQATAVATVAAVQTGTTPATANTVNMDTEQIVASSSGVLAAAAKILGGGARVGGLSKALEVTVPKGAQVLQFTVTDASRTHASRCANAIADAYLADRVNRAQAVVDAASRRLAARLTQLATQEATLAAADPARTSLDAQITAIRDGQAQLASATFFGGAVVSRAVPPSASTKPSLTIFSAAGLVIGLIFGFFCALIADRVSARRAQASDVADGLP